MNIQYAKELLQRYQEGRCTLSETNLINEWYDQLMQTGEWKWNVGEKEFMQQVLETRILKQLNDHEENKISNFRKPAFLSSWFRWFAAASVLFIACTAFYFLLFNKKTNAFPPVATVSQDVKAPQSNKAMITLANGQKVYLDSMQSGTLAMQGNVKLIKLANGEIAYQQSTQKPEGETRYNTLSNPRGSKVISMLLADGSKVWLNAGSSLTYPVSFQSKERKVSITGEAYFEVFHNASWPFIVHNGTMDVRVLGTHFNVNAFEDDNEIKVTLLEGSVKIINGPHSDLLKPGQQASINTEIKIDDDVDMDMVMAWKNGFFYFDNATLKNVLKEISRWYDIEVIYEGQNQPRAFAGEMQRDLSLAEVLKILEKNKVHFTIEGKKLYVLPD